MDPCATNRHFMINNATISSSIGGGVCISLYSYGMVWYVLLAMYIVEGHTEIVEGMAQGNARSIE